MTSHFMCCFLLLTSVIVSSEKRKVQRDSYVLLFETTLTEDNVDKEISLHLNGSETPNLIAKWKFENGAITTIWRLTNYPKIFMDSNRNIMIANIDETYEGKYYIQYFPSLHLREVELSITGNLADEIGEKIKSGLNDLQRFIENYFGNSTDEIKEEITERLNDHHFGCESPSGYLIAILVIVTAILVTVIALLALFLMVHGSEVFTVIINAWSRFRKCIITSKRRQESKRGAGTDPMLPREEGTDKTPTNISESEADFQPTAQGRKKIHIRETEL